MTSALQLEGLGKSFGHFRALHDISLDLQQGEFLTMLGPSGSGKTTTLQLIAGFLQPDRGRLLMKGRDIAGIPAHRRNIGMVFQDYALFPHMTALDNVAFPLESRGIGKLERRRRAEEMLGVVNLGHLLDRYPRQLSGGQKQRVALARALVYDPEVVLLDEPLGALDKKLRTSMQLEILRITRRFGATVISVTHDQEEALVMSDRIALFSQGALAQVGTPKELYAKPANAFVADFVGESNLLPAELTRAGGEAVVKGDGWLAKLPVDRLAVGLADGQVTLMVRPESLRLSAGDASPVAQRPNSIEATVKQVVYLGSALRVHAQLPNGSIIQIAVPDVRSLSFVPETTVRASWDADDVVILQA
ncbi:putative spermidine/putrescine transporter subunit; ATP-binding component of ABC superfamily tranporter [Mesorhizobium plurifarium]|uniref:Spermidine/putrescine import ATP-binding protein PotA n=1 Tax=Mesorhizobium plurifarium TaxID=69974 RepID=A0A090F1U6_MESPL|nr:putative spermidine/putrescine transporter subunit; ATP-binding component of ABC superfamily tranporter [Mesorhizobium plurifarium]